MVVWTGDAQQTPGGIAKVPSQIAITRRHLISRKHALRCPQNEYTPHTLFQALMKVVSHLELPVVANLDAMFQLAVPDLGPLWNPTEISDHRACLDLPTRVCPDCTLRWNVPTADDVAQMPTNVDATIVGEEVNPTTLHLLAYICAALDSVPESLQWVHSRCSRGSLGESCSLPAHVPLESTTQAQWRCVFVLQVNHTFHQENWSIFTFNGGCQDIIPIVVPTVPTIYGGDFTDVWQLRDNVWAICPKMQTFRLRLYDRSGNDFFYVTPFQPSQYFVSVHPSASLVFTNALHQMLVLQAIVHGCQLHNASPRYWLGPNYTMILEEWGR